MVAGRGRDVFGVAAGEAAAGKMADGKAGEEKPEKPQRAGAAGVMEGKIPVAALRSDQLKMKLQTSQQSLQRSPSLDLP
uniref:Uncharacterized protein n=1 Tax=Ovis aries TaxID=9940 RepID=A0AC11AP84_SHEEP